MNIRKAISIVFFLVLLFPEIGLSAGVQGVTDTEVVIGWTTPLSGPGALWGVLSQGGQAWADYINDQGGIHGRKIKVIIRDDGYNPARALANLQEMRNEVFAVSCLLGAAVVQACRDFFAEAKIPCITAIANMRTFEDYPKDKLRYLFLGYPDYEDEGEYVTAYAVKELGMKKLAAFYQNDDYGKMGVVGMQKALSKLQGQAKAVAEVPYEVTERTLSTHALKLKESGAEMVYIRTTPTHGVLILKEMAKIDYRPKILTAFTLADPMMFKLAGDLWEGVYAAGDGHAGMPGSDKEADRVATIIKKYDPRIEGKEYMGQVGAISMMYVAEGLKRAGRELTVEKLIQGMETIKDWKPEGLGGPVTFAPDRRHGVNGVRMFKATGGKYQALTDFTAFKPRF